MNKVELLAPAKDLFKGKIAIDYGADAVYIGGKEFSLRSRASNFSIDEIDELVHYAHERNAKVYVTCNIVFHNSDFDNFEEYISKLDDIGVDAIIVSSFAALKISKNVAPFLPVHFSTQASILNSDACNMLSIFGADKVILGRECSINEIKKISLNTNIPLEVFIHGGMCANLSGRCTLSNRMTNRDANRGGCAHSCRWAYNLYDGEEVISRKNNLFSMSSKDLNAVQYIKDLMEIGISSLKIEGRMKSEYYIAQVVKTYRKLINQLYLKGTVTNKELLYYISELNKAENRPCSSGFFSGKCDETCTLYDENGAGVTHDYVALIKDYDKDKKIATIEVKNIFKKGDILEIFGPSLDNKQMFAPIFINEDDEEIDVANHPMEILKMEIPFEVKPNDMIRIIQNDN